MIVEFVGGGPLDGTRARVDDAARQLVLVRPNLAAFLQPLGPVPGPGEIPDGYERVGAYVARANSPREFLWTPEDDR